MTYVKYETDSAFTEQLRTPLRTLKDQKGDCDCMSILIGSILYNKNIPFCFRVSKYDVNRDFSHVYVIVPRGDAGYYVMDTVIKTFDREKPFAGKEDFYGLYTEAQAQAAGLNPDSFRKMQESYNRARKLFVNTLKGKEDKLKQAISKGVKRRAIKG
jgi:hypothetical protein